MQCFTWHAMQSLTARSYCTEEVDKDGLLLHPLIGAAKKYWKMKLESRIFYNYVIPCALLLKLEN